MPDLALQVHLTASLQSSDEFPIHLNEVLGSVGYARKEDCVDLLKSSFKEAEDYTQGSLAANAEKPKAGPRGGRPASDYRLTRDAFKCLCLMANTAKGRETRKYYLKIEKEYQKMLTDRVFGPESEIQDKIRELASLLPERRSVEYAYSVPHVRATFGFVSNAYTIATIEAELEEGEDYVGEGEDISVCRLGLHKLSVSIAGEIRARVDRLPHAVELAIKNAVKSAMGLYVPNPDSIPLYPQPATLKDLIKEVLAEMKGEAE